MVNKELIIQKLKREYPDKSEYFFNQRADNMMSNCLPQFEQNLLEWCNDQPLTPIPIYEDGPTIQNILDIFPYVEISFVLMNIKAVYDMNHPELIGECFY